MRITSPQFKDGEEIPQEYTCEGPNINPPLNFEEIPPETKSLVLIVEDPDAPANPWVHWLVFNIPPNITKVEENSVPENGIEGLANGGTRGYEGPCPPTGSHKYIFKLYALDAALGLSPESNREMALKAMETHILDEAWLTGHYELHE